MEKVKNYMEKNGIYKKDLPKALFLLKAQGWLTWIGMAGLFYIKSPTAQLANTKFAKYLRKKPKVEKFVSKSKLKMVKWADKIKKLPIFARYSRKAILALTESLLIYKLLYVILLPIHFSIVFLIFKRKKSK